MKAGNQSLFEGDRLSMADSIELSLNSLRAYGERYRHWVSAFSGGKDSSAAVTFVAHAIIAGEIPAPASLTIEYADTRMELPPLQLAAMDTMRVLREHGFKARVVLPPLDDRYFVYMLGRGVPPPTNTMRWCTSQIKIEPMLSALAGLRRSVGEKLLMLTGVRLGESAARDERIVTSCSRDGAECGQGWFQTSTPESTADTLAPLLHWRVCHVWDWLMFYAPADGFNTAPVAKVYGADERTESNNRTGCIGCPLASQDAALRAVIRQPRWEYLAPLTRLKPLYEELRFRHGNRLRKAEPEYRKDGQMCANPQRIGPLTLVAREYGLAVVLEVQRDVNEAARQIGAPEIDILNSEEEARIRELIAANTWPNGWDGSEPIGDELLAKMFRDGTEQPLLVKLESQ